MYTVKLAQNKINFSKCLETSLASFLYFISFNLIRSLIVRIAHKIRPSYSQKCHTAPGKMAATQNGGFIAYLFKLVLIRRADVFFK